MDLMEEDVKAADLVLWVGISFQQSASTMYFRKARCWIQVRAPRARSPPVPGRPLCLDAPRAWTPLGPGRQVAGGQGLTLSAGAPPSTQLPARNLGGRRAWATSARPLSLPAGAQLCPALACPACAPAGGGAAGPVRAGAGQPL